MSIEYNINKHNQKNAGINNINFERDEANVNVTRREILIRRTKSGGFIAWPENMATSANIEQKELTRFTPGGGYIAWP